MGLIHGLQQLVAPTAAPTTRQLRATIARLQRESQREVLALSVVKKHYNVQQENARKTIADLEQKLAMEETSHACTSKQVEALQAELADTKAALEDQGTASKDLMVSAILARSDLRMLAHQQRMLADQQQQMVAAEVEAGYRQRTLPLEQELARQQTQLATAVAQLTQLKQQVQAAKLEASGAQLTRLLNASLKLELASATTARDQARAALTPLTTDLAQAKAALAAALATAVVAPSTPPATRATTPTSISVSSVRSKASSKASSSRTQRAAAKLRTVDDLPIKSCQAAPSRPNWR